MKTNIETTVATDTEVKGYMLRAVRNTHKTQMQLMGIADGPDPVGRALDEAVRCFEDVHGDGTDMQSS